MCHPVLLQQTEEFPCPSVPEVRVHLLERGHTGDGRLALLLPLGLTESSCCILVSEVTVQRSAKRRGCLLSYSQAEPGRELTQPSPRLLAEPSMYFWSV